MCALARNDSGDRNNYLESLDYGNDDSVEYTYDSKGRVTAETYEDGDTVTYTYDNNGALAKVTDSATGRTTTYYYDFTDRLMKQVESGTGYSHAVGYQYDTINNLTQMVETINGVDHTTSYTYDDDNRVESVTTDGVTVEYTYDSFGRVSQQVTKNGETTLLTESFTYTEPAANTTSSQIATYTTTSPGGLAICYYYTYDDNGNIIAIRNDNKTTTYQYDSANQLIRENNQAANYTHTWEYDAGGNILNRKEYAYTTGSLDSVTPTTTASYGYDDVWGDLLTGYDGQAITVDTIGNMLSDGTWAYTWEHGRELASMSDGDTTWTYTYDANGMRTQRTDSTDTYGYIYNSSQLTRMTVDNGVLDFTYDTDGTPLTIIWNGCVYYYLTNLQGDVIAILNDDGHVAGTYTYDTWGVCQAVENDPIVSLNPLRYRGYVYDHETGLYYLQSRYYNPGLFRFINADAFTSTGQSFTGNNMFAYCGNNPVIFADPLGLYIMADDPLRGPFLMNLGGSALGVSTADYRGSSGGAPLPMVDLKTIIEAFDVVSDVADVVSGIKNLSHAAEYGIKGYSSLRKDLKGSGLEAHHIVEVRFLNGLDLDTKNALSVAVTKAEHQKFTNLWRQAYAYGKHDYEALDPMDIYEEAKRIYRNYPELLEAVWDTLF